MASRCEGDDFGSGGARRVLVPCHRHPSFSTLVVFPESEDEGVLLGAEILSTVAGPMPTIPVLLLLLLAGAGGARRPSVAAVFNLLSRKMEDRHSP